MIKQELLFDNSRVSKFSPFVRRFLSFFFLLLFFIVPLLGLFILLALGSSLKIAIIIMFPISIGIASMILLIGLYVTILPTKIAFEEDNFVLIKKKGKQHRVSYHQIVSLTFSGDSYDSLGNPCPKWIADWRKRLLRRFISLTEENAMRLASKLDEKGIQYIRDEKYRKDWEEKTGWKQEDAKN